MNFVVGIIIVIFSVILHELAHGYAALSQGDKTAAYAGRLTLNPISHLDPFGSVILPLLGFLLGGIVIGWAKPVPYNPYNLKNQTWGEAFVAFSGPAANILLAIIFSIVIRLQENLVLPQEVLEISVYIVFLNIVLAIFNLVPIPPLDGSKILFAFFPFAWTELRYKLESYGFFLVLIFIFVLWQPIVAPITTFFFHLLTGINPGII